MKNIAWKKWVSVAGTTVLAYALIHAPSTSAGQNQNSKEKAAPQEKAAAQRTDEKQSASPTAVPASGEEPQRGASAGVAAGKRRSADGSREGIKVHGHWTIEVRNPDGTLATRRDFENSLVATGSATLSQLLTSSYMVTGWEVQLNALLAGDTPPCVAPNPVNGSAGGPGTCHITTPGINTGSAGLFNSPNLSVTGGTGGLILSGTITASFTGTIDNVFTNIYYCAQPGPCVVPLTAAPVTSTNISPVISVTAGQTIAATVKITFS